MKINARQIINLVALIATLAVNAISVMLPLNGQDPGTIVDQYFDSLYLVPADWAFSIWSVIYTGLIIWAVYQAFPSQRDNPLAEKIGWLFVLSCLWNIAWLFLFHYEFFALSTVPMLLLLGTLLTIYVRVREVPNVSTRDHLLYQVPFSIYLGWITVATIANLTFTLWVLGWQDLGQTTQLLAAGTLIVGAAIAAFIGYRQRDITYVAVLVWAYSAIVAKHGDASTIVAAGAVIAIIIAVIGLAAGWFTPGGTQRPVATSAA